MSFYRFFFLDEKEAKSQVNSPTAILFSRKSLRSANEKMAVRTELPKPAAPLPTYAVI